MLDSYYLKSFLIREVARSLARYSEVCVSPHPVQIPALSSLTVSPVSATEPCLHPKRLSIPPRCVMKGLQRRLSLLIMAVFYQTSDFPVIWFAWTCAVQEFGMSYANLRAEASRGSFLSLSSPYYPLL